MSLLQIQNVSKYFLKEQVLKNITLDIPEGALFGFLGPNGAGKTTLIRCITQILMPDSGSIFFRGEKLNPSHIIQMGYMPEERGLYKKMEVYEQLLYLARLKGMNYSFAKNKIDFWLEKFQITDWRNKKIEELSKGMGQKIQFIATVINEPELLILDEPFSGLDPVNAELIQKEILEMNKTGTTIIFSTHRMEQVEQLCEEIILVNKGENILSGKVKDIVQQHKKHLYKVNINGALPHELRDKLPCTIENIENDGFVFQLKDKQSVNEVIRVLVEANIEILGLHEILPTIREIFIQKITQPVAV